MGVLYHIERSGWCDFLSDKIKTWKIYAPQQIQENLFFNLTTKENLQSIIYDSCRPIQPLKSFLFVFKEQVTNIRKFPNLRNTAVLGAKACDLKSLQLLDKIFIEGDFVDPFYSRRRQDLLLISSDCQNLRDSCFCTVMKGSPYPKEGFDLNVSCLNKGFVVEVGSEKGEDFIKTHKKFFERSSGTEMQVKREARRKAVTEKLNQMNSQYSIEAPFLELVRGGYKSPTWEEASKTCVTCGACTSVCPTCYCFLLEDVGLEQASLKFKSWDSCQYTGFARVAGGANPRKGISERLRHRYLHKLDYIRENFGIDGCTGCGRCIEACQGKIDMRKVLSDLKKQPAVSI